MTISLFVVPFFEEKAYKKIAQITSGSPVYFFRCSSEHEKKNESILDLDWIPVESATTKINQEDFLREYLNVVAKFNQWNGKDLRWWASHLSSKNRINSPILPFIQQWVQCLRAAETCPVSSCLVLIDVSWEVIQGLKTVASNRQWSVRVIAPKIDLFRYRLLCKFKFWRNIFSEIKESIESIGTVRRTFKISKLSKRQHSSVYLIKSFTYPRNFQEHGKYQDLYFGKLSEYLRQSFPENTLVLTVALGFYDKKNLYSLMNNITEIVHPLEAYLHYSDVLFRAIQWMWKLVFFPFQIKGRIQFMGYDSTSFFEEWVRCGGMRSSFFQALHFDIAKRLGTRFQIDTCLMTYEGRPWERFFIAGLRSANLDTQIIGCQHTVIPLSAADMFLHSQERNLIPLPDKILTTGKIPKNILERYSSYPKEQVEVSCALRFEYLQNISILKCRTESEYNFTLLVAFGGSEEEKFLLNYAIEQASLNTEVIFRMRNHPTFSWNRLLPLSSWDQSIPENVENSTCYDVLEDLKNCDAVLYWGTTVALESLTVGKPIIHFDRGDVLNYDPLFEFTDFKWQVEQKDPLQTVIEEIQALSEAQYCEHQQKGRAYIEQYFHPVTKNNLEKFLHN